MKRDDRRVPRAETDWRAFLDRTELLRTTGDEARLGKAAPAHASRPHGASAAGSRDLMGRRCGERPWNRHEPSLCCDAYQVVVWSSAPRRDFFSDAMVKRMARRRVDTALAEGGLDAIVRR